MMKRWKCRLGSRSDVMCDVLSGLFPFAAPVCQPHLTLVMVLTFHRASTIMS